MEIVVEVQATYPRIYSLWLVVGVDCKRQVVGRGKAHSQSPKKY